MKNKLHLLFLVLGLSFSGTILSAQTAENTWKTLSKITYKKEYDEMMGYKIDIPVFSDQVKALEGKEIEVKGYILQEAGYKSDSEFILSAVPFSQCFFCTGNGGPEAMMEISAKEPIRLSNYTDAVILKGKLELNDSNINRMIYILNDAELVKKVN